MAPATPASPAPDILLRRSNLACVISSALSSPAASSPSFPTSAPCGFHIDPGCELIPAAARCLRRSLALAHQTSISSDFSPTRPERRSIPLARPLPSSLVLPPSSPADLPVLRSARSATACFPPWRTKTASPRHSRETSGQLAGLCRDGSLQRRLARIPPADVPPAPGA